MGKQIHFDVEAREKLKRGIDALANAVKVTLGPKGRNVVIGRAVGAPHITKDGVTVAREIDLSDPIENIGAQMIKQVAQKTAEIAGDGTTSSVVLAQAIITAGMKNVAAGSNPMDLKRGIDKAVISVVASLRELSQEVGINYEKIQQVAAISANNDQEIGTLIAEAVKAVGKNGVITVEEARGTETELKVVEGMQFDRGYMSPYFVTDMDKMITEFTNPLILICDKKIDKMQDLIPALELSFSENRPLVVIAEDVDGEAFKVLVLNRLQQGMKLASVRAPGFGDRRKEMLADIAILTGGQMISEDLGMSLDKLTLDLLGTSEKIEITKDSTTIINGAGNKENLETRIEQVKVQIAASTVDYDKEKLQERLAKLSGGVAILSVGAPTEVEMKEKKDRVDDALAATRAAVEEGIVPGGGVAFIRAIKNLEDLKGANEDETTGIAIVRRAIEEPLRQIIANCGGEGAVIVQKVREGKDDFGYNARTEIFENLYAAGVIDPTKVTRIAIENAASIASMLLTTECVIADEPEVSSNSHNSAPQSSGPF